MSDFEVGVYTGAFGTLMFIFIVVLIAVGREFGKSYWDTSAGLSIDNWDRKRATRYETDHWRDHHRAD